MKVDEVTTAFSLIEGLWDGSLWSAYKMARLIDTLILGNPDDFYAEYLDVLSLDDPMREKAIGLLKSGKITEATTFDELAAIMAK